MTKRNTGQATGAARQRRHKAKLKDAGLVEVRVWVKPQDADKVRKMDARRKTP